MARHAWRDSEGRTRFTYYDTAADLPVRIVGTPAVKVIPDEYGDLAGKLVIVTNPMNQAPWRIVKPIFTKAGPESFTRIFGDPPVSEDFRDAPNPSKAFRVARVQYAQAQKTFAEGGYPEWATPQQINLSDDLFESWDIDPPLYYRNLLYGWMAHFDGFESSALNALTFTHHVISGYQIKLINNGVEVEKRHPWVPPTLGPAAPGDPQ